MPALTADFYSVQQTIANALEDGTSTTQLPPGVWGKGRYCASYDLSSGTVAKSKTLGMVTIPKGVIVIGIDFLTTVSLGLSVFSIGSSASTAKYRVAAVYTTPLVSWTKFQIATAFATQLAAPGTTAAELIVLANDATADFPTSGTVAVVVHTAEV